MDSRASGDLQRYLSEFDFRYSNRVVLVIDDEARRTLAIKGEAGKRLRIRGVTKPDDSRLERRLARKRNKKIKRKP